MSDKEYSRPASLDDLKRIVEALNEEGADYILIGGYALFSHGYHRATEDIDLLIPAGEKSAGPVVRALMVLEDGESAQLPIEWFDGEENIRLADEVVVDLIFSTCGETYKSLLPYVEHIDVDGVSVQTLSLEGLLKTKQSGREKDQMDRRVIESVLKQVDDEQGSAY